jgi:hypothetical protein
MDKNVFITSGHLVIADIEYGNSVKVEVENGYWCIESCCNNIHLYLDPETDDKFQQDFEIKSQMIGIFDSIVHKPGIPYLKTIPDKEDVITDLENEVELAYEGEFLKYVNFTRARISAYMNGGDKVTHIKICKLATKEEAMDNMDFLQQKIKGLDMSKA